MSRRFPPIVEAELPRVGSLDAAWAAAEAAVLALPRKPNGTGGRYLIVSGPIASGVYDARAVLFDGDAAHIERLNRREPRGFAPPGAGVAAALLDLAAKLREAHP